MWVRCGTIPKMGWLSAVVSISDVEGALACAAA
jgi:hypothetical protein